MEPCTPARLAPCPCPGPRGGRVRAAGAGEPACPCARQVLSRFEGWEGIWAPFQKQNKSKSEPALGAKRSLTQRGRPSGTLRGSTGDVAPGPTRPRGPGGKGDPEQHPAPRCSCQALEGAAHALCWASHLAAAARARSRQRARGIFMEEVHASNSLSSSELAAPAQKDLGAVNNSAW